MVVAGLVNGRDIRAARTQAAQKQKTRQVCMLESRGLAGSIGPHLVEDFLQFN